MLVCWLLRLLLMIFVFVFVLMLLLMIDLLLIDLLLKSLLWMAELPRSSQQTFLPEINEMS